MQKPTFLKKFFSLNSFKYLEKGFSKTQCRVNCEMNDTKKDGGGFTFNHKALRT